MIKTIHLENDGLELFLGSTEAKIMSALWDQHRTPTELYHYLVLNGETMAMTSVYSVIKRLIKKGLIEKIPDRLGRPILTPMTTEDEFLRSIFRKLNFVLSNNYNVTVEYNDV